MEVNRTFKQTGKERKNQAEKEGKKERNDERHICFPFSKHCSQSQVILNFQDHRQTTLYRLFNIIHERNILTILNT